MKPRGLGIDILEIKRFNSFGKSRNSRFLLNNYSKKEIDYCFSFKKPVPHLAGTFAAKEAVFKALGQSNILLSLVEIRRNKSGQPEVWIKNRRQKSILISISHAAKIAAAIAIKQ
ncbi:MAG: 4'-phosphopantetheinyl transferase superfamily protein [Candidatus Azambacteria bacterium]|nr:4'-phosphopantetheinyl transferase superfamily protein [Candidatus Azambacteria bacterium]